MTQEKREEIGRVLRDFMLTEIDEEAIPAVRVALKGIGYAYEDVQVSLVGHDNRYLLEFKDGLTFVFPEYIGLFL